MFQSRVRPLLMLLEKWYQKTAFLIINFPTGFFQSHVLIFTAYQNKKKAIKSSFHRPVTRRRLLVVLYWRVCSMYTQSTVCFMSPTARRQGLRHIGPLPTLCTYLQPWRSTAHGLRSFRTCTTTQQMHLEGRYVPCKQYCASGL